MLNPVKEYFKTIAIEIADKALDEAKSFEVNEIDVYIYTFVMNRIYGCLPPVIRFFAPLLYKLIKKAVDEATDYVIEREKDKLRSL